MERPRSSQMRRRSKQYYTFFRASRHCLHFNKFSFCLFSLPSCLSPSSPSAPASVSSCVLVGSVRGCPVSLVVSMPSVSCGSMVFVSGFIALFACQDCRYLKLRLGRDFDEVDGRQIARPSAAPLTNLSGCASERRVKIDLVRGSATAFETARKQRIRLAEHFPTKSQSEQRL